MSLEFNAKVTPSLHPENVRRLSEGNEELNSLLAQTETAFSTAYEGIGAVWAARTAAERNPSWTPEQRILQVSILADKKSEVMARHFDMATATLEKQIAFIEKELSAPVEATAGKAFASEIRAHAKGLKVGERETFIRQAIAEKDVVTVGALLGAPAYLSGLTRVIQMTYVRMYRETAEPQKAQQLKALKAAEVLIGERSGLIFTELEKAIGAPRQRVHQLQLAQNAAIKALELT